MGAGGCGPVAHHPVSRAWRQSLHCGLSPPGASEGPLRGIVRDEGRAPLSWGLSLSQGHDCVWAKLFQGEFDSEATVLIFLTGALHFSDSLIMSLLSSCHCN